MLAVVAPEKETETTSRQLSWFAERVERGRKEPFVEVVTITPAIAARLLEMNDGNRPISERLVKDIASDIEHGFWQLNGETIIVSREGLLNDGQHRLEAVVRTGRPIQSAVMFGVERRARMTVDMGKQRTAGNFLAMSNVSNSNNVAAVTRALMFYDRGIYAHGGGGRKGNFSPTKQDLLDYYEAHKKDIDNAVHELINDKFIRSAGSTAFIAAYVILHRANPVECGVFFARVSDGANLKSTDPVLWLRGRFMTPTSRKQFAVHERIELILNHWNRWRVGAKVNRAIGLNHSYPKVLP